MINVIHMITDELTRELTKDFRDLDTGMFTESFPWSRPQFGDGATINDVRLLYSPADEKSGEPVSLKVDYVVDHSDGSRTFAVADIDVEEFLARLNAPR